MRLRIESLLKASLFISVLTMAACAYAAGAPSLEQVLSHGTARGMQDFSIIIASLLALSLATISVARGYDVVKKGRRASTPEQDLGQKIDEISKMLDNSHDENNKLKDKLNLLSSESEELNRAESILRKSNAALSKECDRLKSENESMLMKSNTMEIKLAEIAAKVAAEKMQTAAPKIVQAKKVKILKKKAGAIAKKKGRGKK